jgi:ribosome-associated protein
MRFDRGKVRIFRKARTPVATIEFPLQGEYVALCDLLKCAGIAGRRPAPASTWSPRAGSGSTASPKARKTAKIRAGQVVECEGRQVLVGAANRGPNERADRGADRDRQATTNA